MKASISRPACFALIAAAAFIAGCNKTNNANRSALLTKASWKYTSILYNGREDIQDCEKDDVESYKTGLYSFSKGADDCSGTESDASGTWQLIDNDSKIVYDGTDTAIVIMLDEANFRYKFSDDSTTLYLLQH